LSARTSGWLLPPAPRQPQVQAGNNGEAPWNTIINNTFANNLLLGDVNAIFNALNGAQPSGQFTVTSLPGRDIVITNNLWQRVLGACGSNSWVGGFLQTASGYNVTFTHNTIRNVNDVNPVMNVGAGIILDGLHSGQTNLAVKDNIFNYGPSGFAYNSPHGYQGAWPPSGIVEEKNIVIIDGRLTSDPRQAGEMPNSIAWRMTPRSGSATWRGRTRGVTTTATHSRRARPSKGGPPMALTRVSTLLRSMLP
jgi:hypothetical protein